MYSNTDLQNTFTEIDGKQFHQRVDAQAAVSLKHDGDRTRLDRLYQRGSAKIRFPKHHDGPMEAVLINTAGGLTGGDKVSWNIRLDNHCKMVATTQACEKSYKSVGGEAVVETSLSLGRKSRLHWLPQETILYDGSALQRTFRVDMEADAELLALESVILGREAMGEAVASLRFHDHWRISKNNALVFADDLRLTNRISTAAGFGAHRALASLLFIAPSGEEERLALVTHLREICAGLIAGFSSFNGKITGRILARDSYQLRHILVPVLDHLRGIGLPRVWRI